MYPVQPIHKKRSRQISADFGACCGNHRGMLCQKRERETARGRHSGLLQAHKFRTQAWGNIETIITKIDCAIVNVTLRYEGQSCVGGVWWDRAKMDAVGRLHLHSSNRRGHSN